MALDLNFIRRAVTTPLTLLSLVFLPLALPAQNSTPPQQTSQAERLIQEGDRKARVEFRYEEALPIYQKALEAARKEGARGAEADSLIRLGVVSRHLGKYDQALGFYQQVLPLVQKYGDKNAEAGIRYNIALVYENMGQPE